MKHRSRIEITSVMLDIANGGGVKKTKLMNKANLSHKQLKELLMFLTNRDLIYHDIKTETFKTTEKGLGFLRLYNEIDDMVKKLPLTP